VVIFTFRLTKTSLHKGQLMIAFFPGFVSGSPTLAQSEYCNRLLYDISSGETLEVEVPYTSCTNYLNCAGDDFGSLFVYVQNPLTAPSNVAQSIDVDVSVRAAPGFTFAVPSDALPVAIYSVAAQGAQKASQTTEERYAIERSLPPATAELWDPAPIPAEQLNHTRQLRTGRNQMRPSSKVGRKDDSTAVPVKMTLGTSRPTPVSVDNDVACIGERVLSVRQLLHRFYPVQVQSGLASPTGFAIRPWTIGYVTSTGTAAVIGSFSFDLFSMCGGLFAYRRGGIRILLNSLGSTYTRFAITSINQNNPIAAFTGLYASLPTGMGAGQMTTSALQQPISVPQYLQLSHALCRYGSDTTPEPKDALASVINLGITSAGTTSATLYRSAEEDTDFGFYLGVPTYYLASGN